MSEMNKCERTEELVSYFYGEGAAAERRSFEQHLDACRVCRAELSAFGEVRGAVGAWRAEVIERASALPLGAFVPESARNGRPVHAVASTPTSRRRAFDALREFFTLTPLWLRAGMVAASLALCALAALALVNAQLRWDDQGLAFGWGRQTETAGPAGPRQTPQQIATEARYTQADVDRLAAERDAAQRELASARAQLDAAQQQAATLEASLTSLRGQRQTLLASGRAARGKQANAARRSALSAQQLANALEPEEDELRLSDLLTEVSAGREQPPSRRNER